MAHKNKNQDHLEEEARAFDEQAIERDTKGLVPDLERLQIVPYFYNNPWREPEFFNIQIRPRVDFILNAVKGRRGRVLEVGSGPGFLALEMARAGCDVTGIDVSPKAVGIAEYFAKKAKKGKTFGSLTYKVADIMSIPVEKGAYDSIVFLGSLHHFAKPDALLKRVAEMLKPKGNVVVCEPVRESFTKESAVTAGLLRAVLETWEPLEAKAKKVGNHTALDRYVGEIFDEYTYKHEHQSPNDNLTASEKVMVSAIKKLFAVKAYERADAFSDKLIGGLWGPKRFVVARILKQFDDYMVKEDMLPATSIRIWGVKK